MLKVVRKIEDKIKELEARQDAEFQKIFEMLDRFSSELYSFRRFLESLLRLLLDVSLSNEPVKSLTALLKASTHLPDAIMRLYLKEAVRKAHDAGIKYEGLFDALMNSFGESIRDLELTNIIKRHYGANIAQKWEQLLRNSNPSITCIRDVKTY